jgi:AcrR family transcriptional regulator
MPDSATKRPGRPAKADSYGRQERGEQTRQRIIDAAIELFAESGWRNTGVAALAKRVGMSGPGLLYYFGSKERLLLEVVAERERLDALEVWDQLQLSDLRAQGRHRLSSRLLTKLYVVLETEALEPGQPLHEFFVDRHGRGRALIRRILDVEIIEGRARADIDVEQLVAEISAFTVGLEFQWLSQPDDIDIAAVADRYFDELTRRIAIPPRQENHAYQS